MILHHALENPNNGFNCFGTKQSTEYRVWVLRTVVFIQRQFRITNLEYANFETTRVSNYNLDFIVICLADISSFFPKRSSPLLY